MKIINAILIMILATRITFSMEADVQPSLSDFPVELITDYICTAAASDHDLISVLKNLLVYRSVNRQWNDICMSVPNVKRVLSHCKQKGLDQSLFEIIKAIFGKLVTSISRHTPVQRAALHIFLKNNQFSLEQKIEILAPLAREFGWYDGMFLASLFYSEYTIDLDFEIPQRNAQERRLARAYSLALEQHSAEMFGQAQQAGKRKSFLVHIRKVREETAKYDDLLQLLFNWFANSHELEAWLQGNPAAITNETAQLIERIKNADAKELIEMAGNMVNEYAYIILWATMVFGTEPQVRVLVKHFAALERINNFQLTSMNPCLYITAMKRGYFAVPRCLRPIDLVDKVRMLNLYIEDPISQSLFINILRNDQELLESYQESEFDQYVNSFSQDEVFRDTEIIVLLRAARVGNIEFIKKCLPMTGQFKIDAKDLGNILLVALKHGHGTIVRYLNDINLAMSNDRWGIAMSDSDDEFGLLVA